MQLFHGRLLAVLPVLILAIITVMPVAQPMAPLDRMVHSSIHPRKLLALQARGPTTDTSDPLKKWLGSVIAILLSDKEQLNPLLYKLSKAAGSYNQKFLEEKIVKSLKKMRELYGVVEHETKRMSQHLEPLVWEGWRWSLDLTDLDHRDYSEMSRRLCWVPGEKKTADELHKRFSYVMNIKPTTWRREFREINEHIFIFITGLRKACTLLYPHSSYAVSPGLQTLRIFNDVFGSVNLPNLLNALSTTTARVAHESEIETCHKLRRISKILQGTYKRVLSEAKELKKLDEFSVTGAQEKKVEMWQVPKDMTVAPTPTFFAISKQLCYARHAWQHGSNGHPRVKTNEKTVDTLDHMINGALAAGLLDFIDDHDDVPEATAQKFLDLHSEARLFIGQLDEFCRVVPDSGYN